MFECILGKTAPLSFLFEQADYFLTDSGVVIFDGHATFLGQIQIDQILHYCYAYGMFLKRLGPDPHVNGEQTSSLAGCPDIFELETGDFAIIGVDITDKAIAQLPPTAGCGPDERIICIPRKTLVRAKGDIPDRL